MTQEYQSKVNGAFKMVLDEIKTVHAPFGVTIKEEDVVLRLSELVYCLANNLELGSMTHQKKNCKLTASTAILYMVKFL